MGISKKSENMGDKPSSVKINDQKVAEGLGMRKIGGTSQLFSPAQGTEKASIASVLGHQNLLLKRGN